MKTPSDLLAEQYWGRLCIDISFSDTSVDELSHVASKESQYDSTTTKLTTS